LSAHCGLLDLLSQFLEHVVWEKEKTQIAKKVCVIFIRMVCSSYVDTVS